VLGPAGHGIPGQPAVVPGQVAGQVRVIAEAPEPAGRPDVEGVERAALDERGELDGYHRGDDVRPPGPIEYSSAVDVGRRRPGIMPRFRSRSAYCRPNGRNGRVN
jgi:hypothetical protein